MLKKYIQLLNKALDLIKDWRDWKKRPSQSLKKGEGQNPPAKVQLAFITRYNILFVTCYSNLFSLTFCTFNFFQYRGIFQKDT